LQKQITNKNEAKIFVLDTNVLLHDPQCLHKFEDNTVAIPVEVLEELDRKKSAPGELGFAARKIHRELRAFFNKEFAEPPEVKGKGSSALSCKLPGGGHLILIINDYIISKEPDSEAIKQLRATLVDIEKMDSRILASVLFLKEAYTESRVVLVTKDANMALKGISLGLQVQDYMNDKIAAAKENGGIRTISVEESALKRFKRVHSLDLEPKLTEHLYLNEYIYLSCGDQQEPARYRGEGQIDGLILDRGASIKIPKGVQFNPLNDEQRMLIDALLDEDIKLVTCIGKAGTGKTLVSIAMALYQAIGQNSLYEHVFITRPLVHIGKDTGALPGTLEEKMAPYIAPFYDNLEVLFSNRKVVKRPAPNPKQERLDRITSNRKRKKAMAKLVKQSSRAESEDEDGTKLRKPYQFLFDYGIVEVEAMTYIRGRSLANTIFIIDEAQNLTPHEAKTVVSRMAVGSKVVLLGDPAQVDNMFLDATSNGLVHTAQRLKGTEITAHLKLTAGVRSELSDLAADRL
jgi:PhoH-like ATPase